MSFSCPDATLYVNDCICWTYAVINGSCAKPRLYAIRNAGGLFHLVTFDVRSRKKERFFGFIVESFTTMPDLQRLLEESNHSLVKPVCEHKKKGSSKK